MKSTGRSDMLAALWVLAVCAATMFFVFLEIF